MKDQEFRWSQAAEDVLKAEKRLAGDKVYQIIVLNHDLAPRHGDYMGDYIYSRLSQLGPCRDCKGLTAFELDDFNRGAKIFRFSCGRTRVAYSLTCDDGVKVFINGKKEVESIFKETMTNSLNWDSDISGSPLRGKTADYMIMDEVSSFDDREFMKMKEMKAMKKAMVERNTGLGPFKHKIPPVVSKDLPKTLGDDAW